MVRKTVEAMIEKIPEMKLLMRFTMVGSILAVVLAMDISDKEMPFLDERAKY